MNVRLSIPVMNGMITSDEARAAYLDELRRAGADRVLLCPERDMLFRADEDNADELRLLDGNVRFFRENGLEVGVWIQAFGFGVPLTRAQADAFAGVTRIRAVTGGICGDAFCPEDGRFMEAYTRLVRALAALHPDLLLLDDDLCLSVRPGLGCFCDRHLSLLSDALGEPISGPDGTVYNAGSSAASSAADGGAADGAEDAGQGREALPFASLPQKLFTGGRNRYRTAWLDVMGGTLRRFCRAVRAAADSVDPTLRVGFCAGFTSFDMEGADAGELSLLLSGERTEPLLRLSGAPYWCVNHNNRFPDQRLHTVIEFVRAQEAWCRGMGIELFHEGDVYPRPRTVVPAAWLECYDGALRASGGIHSFKYMLDYVSAPGYETGYVKRHLRDLPLFGFLAAHFDGKAADGVRLFETEHKAADLICPPSFMGESAFMQRSFSPAAAMLTENGVPVCYEDGPAVGAAFGENILKAAGMTVRADGSVTPPTRRLPRRMIVDLTAARLLAAAGADVGIAGETPFSTDVELTEEFGSLSPDEYRAGHRRISLVKAGGARIAAVRPADGARVLSRFTTANGDSIPASVVYESRALGTELLIYPFEAAAVRQSSGLFVSYERQRQLLDFAGGFPYVADAPYLYTLLKRGDGETAVFFANINDDDLFDFDIILDRDYAGFTLCGAEGVRDGRRIHVSGSVPPYGMFALVLKENG